MRVLILGGTGFVGTPLAASLMAQGCMVTVTSRHVGAPEREYLYAPQRVQWDGVSAQSLAALLAGQNVVIHLQGENIGAGRWTAARRQAIVQSRVQAGRAIVEAVGLLRHEGEDVPHTLVQASACGYYGLWDNADMAPECAEDSPAGTGFLADTCVRWEESTRPVEALGLRRCILRLAPVLGHVPSGAVGGFLGRLVTPFHFFAGAVPGTGRQPLSWVHMDDVLGMVERLLYEARGESGVFNVCAPQSTDMHHFVHTLGQVLRRPVLGRLPAPFLRMLLGDMAEELVLAGQKTVPGRALAGGYAFRFGRLAEALRDVLE